MPKPHAIPALVEQYQPATIATLAGAGLCAPSANHRGPALSILLDWALCATRFGQKRATAADLPSLVEAVHRALPDLWSLTDFIPLDPRIDAVVRWRGRTFRIHPGFVERPIAMVQKAGLVAAAVDPVLRSRFGFGLGDLVELLLRYMHTSVLKLAPYWTAEMPEHPEATPTITPAEVEAYAKRCDLRDLCADCSDQEAARLALAALTVPSSSLVFDVASGTAWFGMAARVVPEQGAMDVSLPAALMLETIEAASAMLAQQALDLDASAGERFHRLAARRVDLSLSRARLPLQRLGRLHVVDRWVVGYGERSSLVVELMSSLAGRIPEQLIEDRYERLQATGPGAILDAGTGRSGIAADARVAHLLVLAVPRHIAVQGQGALMPLEDLDWITSRVRDDPDALFNFCRDLAEPGVGTVLAMETVNQFEHWWGNGQSLHRAGIAVELLSLEMHRGGEEWNQAGRDATLERALEVLHLPQLSSWVHQDRSRSSVELFDPYRAMYLVVTPAAQPFAVGGVFGDFSAEVGKLVELIARGIAWRLGHALAGAALVPFPLRIRLLEVEEDQSELPVLALSSAVNRAGLVELVIGVSKVAVDLLRGDAAGFEHLLGSALSHGIDRAKADWRRADEFLEAWSAAPPGIRSDAFRPVHVIQHSSQPQKPDVAARSRCLRALGQLLASRQMPQGRLVGEEVCALESDIVFPALRSQLHSAMARYSAPALLDFALTELERAHGFRVREERSLAFRQRFPIAVVNPLAETGKIIDDATRITRAIEITIEEVLLQRPSGPAAPDRMEWRELLAISDLMLESGMRSEQAHLGLQAVSVDVSDWYELLLRLEGIKPDVNLDLFHEALLREAQIGPGRSYEESTAEPQQGSEPDRPGGVLAALPRLQGVDLAMRESMPFSLDGLVRIVAELQAWPVTEQRPFAWASRAAIVAFCEDAGVGSATEVEAVLNFLTLDAQALGGQVIEHWEQERRSVRVANRPFIEGPGHTVAIGPWALHGFLRRLYRYLDDGRLVWPDGALPNRVVRELRTYRAARNDEFEGEVLQLIRTSAGLQALGRVKKAKTIGLPSLPGEIDVLALDEQRGRIWVIEIKDPFEAFSYAMMRYSIDDFHDDSRSPRHVAKLLTKAATVREGMALVAAAFGPSNAGRPWDVRPLIVTRRPIAAAYVRQSRVSFAFIGELVDRLSE